MYHETAKRKGRKTTTKHLEKGLGMKKLFYPCIFSIFKITYQYQRELS